MLGLSSLEFLVGRVKALHRLGLFLHGLAVGLFSFAFSLFSLSLQKYAVSQSSSVPLLDRT